MAARRVYPGLEFQTRRFLENTVHRARPPDRRRSIGSRRIPKAMCACLTLSVVVEMALQGTGTSGTSRRVIVLSILTTSTADQKGV